MKKKRISLLIIILMCISIFCNLTFAEKVNNDDVLEDVNAIDFESSENYLFELVVANSQGEPLKNGHAYIYSYLEEKYIGDIKVNDNGRAIFKYQPPKDTIKKEMDKKDILDVHYAVFITDGEELVLEGFTQTYYAPHLIKEEFRRKASDTIMTDKEKVFEIKTKKVKDVDGLTVYDSSVVEDISVLSDFSTMGVVESRDLGSKRTDFIVANVAKDCTTTGRISTNTKTTLTGSNVISAEYSASSSMTVSQPVPAATRGFRHVFYTYYNYVEEKHRYTHGGDVYEFYRLRANKWNGGIGYSSYLEPKNEVSPSTINHTNTYGPGSDVELKASETFTIGAAFSITGPLSGTNYSVGLTHRVGQDKDVYRKHGNTTYYEYGTGKAIVDKYITRY